MSREFPYLPGATTVGIVCKDGVILASEKKVVYGYFVMSKAGKKVFKIAEKVGAACAGLMGDMQILTMEVAAYMRLHSFESHRALSVNTTAKVMANILFERRLFPLLTQTIIGGVDDEGPHLYILDPLGSVIPDKFTSVGSGAEIATGILESEYTEGMSTEEGKDLVTRVIRAATARDIQSGEGIDFLIITNDGMKEETLSFK